MVSDRTLQTTFGMSPQTVALWGSIIRAFTALFTCLVLAALAGVYANTARNTIEIRQGQDFGVFYESALSARAGSGPRTSKVPTEERDLPLSPNLNPPHFNVVLTPFTWVDLPRASIAWLTVSLLSLMVSLAAVIRIVGFQGWATIGLCAFAFAATPMIATLFTGQVGLLLLVPFTLAWAYARQGRQVPAGVWIGVCASVKPFFLLFTAYFVVRRWTKAAALSCLTVVVCFGGGVAVSGVDAYGQWIADLRSVTWAEHFMNASILGFVERTLSASEWHQVSVVDWPQLVMPVSVIAFLGMGLSTLARVRTIPSIDGQFLLVMVSALLMSPLGWVYYLWFLIPPVAATIHAWDAGQADGRGVLMACGLIGFLVPPLLVVDALGWSHGLGTITVGSVYFWALMALWIAGMRAAARPAEPQT